MRIRYTLRAYADLQRIHSDIAQFNPLAAARVIDTIERRVNFLQDSPALGYPSDATDIRILLAIPHPYRIYYRIVADTVEIIHVRHTSRRLSTASEL